MDDEESDTETGYVRVSDGLILKVQVDRWGAHYAMPDDMISGQVVGVQVRRREVDFW